MRVGDYGVKLTLDTRTDLTNATAFIVRIRRPPPDNSVVDHALTNTAIVAAVPPATFATKIRYITQAGDFPTPGVYQIEVINDTSGTVLTSDPVEYYVGAGLPAS